MEFYFIFPIQPQPKARHRTAIRNHRIIHHSDLKTKAFEQAIKLYSRQQFHQKPLTQALRGVFLFKLQKPGKGKKGSKMSEPIVVPDLDNLLKAVCDGMNKIVYNDDAQITELCCKKIWTIENEKPSIQVWLDTLDENGIETPLK